MKFLHYIKLLLLSFFPVLILFYYLTLYYVNNYKLNDTTEVYKSCSKQWSSRGVYNTHKEQNSLKSFSKAFKSDYSGVEVDFYYDVSLNKFIVSHGKPSKNSTETLFTLEKLFHELGKNHYFWLDFKNLDRITMNETDKAIKHLKEITVNDSIKDKIYIEGSTVFKLSKYKAAGFKTLFALSPLPESSFFSSVASNVLKIAYSIYGFSGVAIPYGDLEDPKYGKQTQKNLSGIPTFIFHVPVNEPLLLELSNMDDVRVILAGRDKSLNIAYINSCK